MGLLQRSNHLVQNRQTGEQMRHWDMLNKENSNFVAFFKHVSVRHLFSSLYHVIAQMQMARVEEYIFVEGFWLSVFPCWREWRKLLCWYSGWNFKSKWRRGTAVTLKTKPFLSLFFYRCDPFILFSHRRGTTGSLQNKPFIPCYLQRPVIIEIKLFCWLELPRVHHRLSIRKSSIWQP